MNHRDKIAFLKREGWPQLNDFWDAGLFRDPAYTITVARPIDDAYRIAMRRLAQRECRELRAARYYYGFHRPVWGEWQDGKCWITGDYKFAGKTRADAIKHLRGSK